MLTKAIYLAYLKAFKRWWGSNTSTKEEKEAWDAMKQTVDPKAWPRLEEKAVKLFTKVQRKCFR